MSSDVPRAAHERLVLQLAEERDLVYARLNEAWQREDKLRQLLFDLADRWDALTEAEGVEVDTAHHHWQLDEAAERVREIAGSE